MAARACRMGAQGPRADRLAAARDQARPLSSAEKEEAMKDAFEKRRYVPMRFMGRCSCIMSDAGFGSLLAIKEQGLLVRVLFNGVDQIGNVVIADPMEGAIWTEQMVNGSPALVKQCGHVEIFLLEPT
jgi:hypothetical protein